MKGMQSMKMMCAKRMNTLAALQKKEMTEGQDANQKDENRDVCCTS